MGYGTARPETLQLAHRIQAHAKFCGISSTDLRWRCRLLELEEKAVKAFGRPDPWAYALANFACGIERYAEQTAEQLRNL